MQTSCEGMDADADFPLWGLEDEMESGEQSETKTDACYKKQSSQTLKVAREKKLSSHEMALNSRRNTLTPSAMYNCNKCQFVTEDFMAYISHKNKHVDWNARESSLFTCGMCSFCTPFAIDMMQHIQCHMKPIEASPPFAKDTNSLEEGRLSAEKGANEINQTLADCSSNTMASKEQSTATHEHDMETQDDKIGPDSPSDCIESLGQFGSHVMADSHNQGHGLQDYIATENNNSLLGQCESVKDFNMSLSGPEKDLIQHNSLNLTQNKKCNFSDSVASPCTLEEVNTRKNQLQTKMGKKKEVIQCYGANPKAASTSVRIKPVDEAKKQEEVDMESQNILPPASTMPESTARACAAPEPKEKIFEEVPKLLYSHTEDTHIKLISRFPNEEQRKEEMHKSPVTYSHNKTSLASCELADKQPEHVNDRIPSNPSKLNADKKRSMKMKTNRICITSKVAKYSFKDSSSNLTRGAAKKVSTKRLTVAQDVTAAIERNQPIVCRVKPAEEGQRSDIFKIKNNQDELVDYLQLKRVKPLQHDTAHAINSSSTNPSHKICDFSKDQTTDVENENSHFELDYIYSHSKPVLIKYHSDRHSTVTTSKGVKAVKPSKPQSPTSSQMMSSTACSIPASASSLLQSADIKENKISSDASQERLQGLPQEQHITKCSNIVKTNSLAQCVPEQTAQASQHVHTPSTQQETAVANKPRMCPDHQKEQSDIVSPNSWTRNITETCSIQTQFMSTSLLGETPQLSHELVHSEKPSVTEAYDSKDEVSLPFLNENVTSSDNLEEQLLHKRCRIMLRRNDHMAFAFSHSLSSI